MTSKAQQEQNRIEREMAAAMAKGRAEMSRKLGIHLFGGVPLPPSGEPPPARISPRWGKSETVAANTAALSAAFDPKEPPAAATSPPRRLHRKKEPS